MTPPAPTGLSARYFGPSGGTTARYYWVQAIYPDGVSLLGGSVTVTTIAGLSSTAVVLITWNPMPGAIAYNIFETTTSTAPSGNGSFGVRLGHTGNAVTDDGTAYLTTTISYTAPSGFGFSGGSQLHVAYAQYNFAVDGGAVGAITPATSDTIPDRAIMLGGVVNVTAAATSSAAMTISVGTTAGSSASSILAATAKASLTLDALLNAVPVFATPVKMTAAGQINITIATTAATGGIIEIFVLYVVPSLL